MKVLQRLAIKIPTIKAIIVMIIYEFVSLWNFIKAQKINQIPPKPTKNPEIVSMRSHLYPPINKKTKPIHINITQYKYLLLWINSASSFFYPQASLEVIIKFFFPSIIY